MSSEQDPRAIDTALARLPEWQTPPGFAARVVLGAREREAWTPLPLRGMGIAACVSVAAWGRSPDSAHNLIIRGGAGLGRV